MDYNIKFPVKKKDRPVILGLTGYAQSGKDTAAGFLVARGWRRLAFADILRSSLYNLNPIVPMPLEGAPDHWARVQDLVDWKGWDVAKVEYPEIRQLLQRFGTEVGRELYGENFWVERVMSQIKPREHVVITDVRFPNEEKAVHDAGGRVFRIVRTGVNAVNGHASELEIDKLRVDGVIPNTNGLDLFESDVLEAAGLN
jgi:hypothetical protein